MVKIVGILNVTPDSFSDGGKFNSKYSAISQVTKLMEEGADMIDIGAESTRPTATAITAEEEWQRLEKILPSIILQVKKFNKKHSKNVQTSIDSYHFETVKKAYECGVDVINDVSGLSDDRIVEFIAQNNITTILMHNAKIETNPDLIINPHIHITGEILNWIEDKLAYLSEKGVKKSQLILDLGIGFNKNAKQSIRILKNIDVFRIFDLPLYIGHSKKSFLAEVDFSDFTEGNAELDKAEKTLIISKYLAKKRIDFLRVHDVKETIVAIS